MRTPIYHIYGFVVEYGHVPVIRARYGTYQKIKCVEPACRTIDVPANMSASEQHLRMDSFAWSNSQQIRGLYKGTQLSS